MTIRTKVLVVCLVVCAVVRLAGARSAPPALRADDAGNNATVLAAPEQPIFTFQAPRISLWHVFPWTWSSVHLQVVCKGVQDMDIYIERTNKAIMRSREKQDNEICWTGTQHWLPALDNKHECWMSSGMFWLDYTIAVFDNYPRQAGPAPICEVTEPTFVVHYDRALLTLLGIMLLFYSERISRALRYTMAPILLSPLLYTVAIVGDLIARAMTSSSIKMGLIEMEGSASQNMIYGSNVWRRYMSHVLLTVIRGHWELLIFAAVNLAIYGLLYVVGQRKDRQRRSNVSMWGLGLALLLLFNSHPALCGAYVFAFQIRIVRGDNQEANRHDCVDALKRGKKSVSSGKVDGNIVGKEACCKGAKSHNESTASVPEQESDIV